MAVNVVLTVGSVLRGDDAAGPMLAKMMEDHPIEGWTIVDGGQTPEDDLAPIRRMAPGRIVLVDAAAMGLEPGAIRQVTRDDVAQQFLITTHSLPITFLLSELERCCDDVTFIGIQPQSMGFYDPLNGPVLAAVENLYRCIEEGAELSQYGPCSCGLGCNVHG